MDLAYLEKSYTAPKNKKRNFVYPESKPDNTIILFWAFCVAKVMKHVLGFQGGKIIAKYNGRAGLTVILAAVAEWGSGQSSERTPGIGYP